MSDTLAIDGGSPVRDESLPFTKISYGYEELREVLDVFESGTFCSVMPTARKVPAFEEAFAEYVGTRYAVAFSSGTTAQHASLVAAGVGPGDEVIVPPLTFASTAYTVFMVGATPVFADVDDDTITLDPARVIDATTERTRAIVPVHWFGHPAAMNAIMEHADRNNIAVIEDCAHAYGARYQGRNIGTIGAMSCWSLQQSKILTAAGEGGVLATNDEGHAQMAQSMRDHGKDKTAPAGVVDRYTIVRVGNNYRLSELHAGFALAQLRKAEHLQGARQAHTGYLDAGLGDVPGVRRPQPADDVTTGYPYYPVRFSEGRFSVDLHKITDALQAEGIDTIRIAEEEFVPDHPLFRENCGPADLPVAEQISKELMLLPLYPDLARSDLDDIITAVKKVTTAYAA
jgi:dTDP-4-amino-4,6-dideoxygalactose transaminase